MPAVEPAPASSRAPLGLQLLLGTLMALGPLSIDTYLPAFPAIAAGFGVESAAVQVTLATYFAGLALGQVVYGPLADRFGRRGPLLVGMTVYVLAAIGAAAAPSLAALAGWRFVQALGGCAGMVITRAVVRDRFAPREMARVFSQLMLVMGVAPIVAPLVGSALLGLAGWRGIFWALAAFAPATLAAQAWWLDESLPPSRRARHGPSHVVRTYVRIARDRRFLAAVFGAGLLWSTLFVYIGGVPFVYMDLHGVDASRFGVLFGINAAGLVAMSQLNARLLRTHAPAVLLRIGALLVAAAAVVACAALISGVGGLPGIAVPLFAMLAGLGFVGGNASSAALAPFADAAGSASALMGTLQYGIGAVMGAVAAALFDGTGRGMAVTLAAAACAGAAIIVLGRVARD